MKPIVGWMVVYWGPKYDFLDKYAERAMQSKKVEAVLVGDIAHQMPSWLKAKRIPVSVDEFVKRASEVAGVDVRKTCMPDNPGKSNAQLRWMIPDCYPEVFSDYAWTGYTEVDVVWGDMDALLTDELLGQYDVLSTNSYLAVNGPGTLFRNTPEIRSLWRSRMDMFADPKALYIDEAGMNQAVKDSKLRWKSLGVERHWRSDPWNRCQLINGKLFEANQQGKIGQEIFTFHFSNPKRWPVQ